MTVLLYIVLTLATAVLLFAVSSLVFGRGEDLPPMRGGEPAEALPEGPLTGADLEEVRLPMVVRGYRMADVDEVIARAGEEIDRLREELRSATARME